MTTNKELLDISENETPPLTTLPPAQAERSSFTDAGGECVGDVGVHRIAVVQDRGHAPLGPVG